MFSLKYNFMLIEDDKVFYDYNSLRQTQLKIIHKFSTRSRLRKQHIYLIKYKFTMMFLIGLN